VTGRLNHSIGFLAAACLLFATPVTAGPTEDRLAGRTLDVMVGFSNSGGGARFWQVFSSALRRALPKTVIRARFNDVGSGAAGSEELFRLEEGALAVGFVRPPDIIFAQQRLSEEAAFDFARASWIAGVERESFIMAARRGLSTDPDALRNSNKQLISPVSDMLATHATVAVLLNAVTGIDSKIVVGFKSSARLKSIIAGDTDFYTVATDAELQPLLESGDVVPLYTIVGEAFPDEVVRERSLESFLVEGAPQSVVDYIKVSRGMGRGFFAPPGVAEEDVAALRAVFSQILQDPQFIADAEATGTPVAYVGHDEFSSDIDKLALSDPDARAEMQHAYDCGLAMSEGKVAACEFE
jgi:tripartite-type tricarboxylate transporter receptor subunit TctC